MSKVLSLLSIVIGFMSSTTWGAGKSAPVQNPPCTAPSTTLPVHKVVLQAVQTKPFQLPNGVTVDLSSDLNAIFSTVVTQTNVFSPFEPGQALDPCDDWIEIRAAVSTFQLAVDQYGITVGYSPAGTNTGITNATGKVDVAIGTIAMEFSVWEHSPSGASEIIAQSADQNTASVSGSFTVDFNLIHVGADFSHLPVIQDTIRSIMQNGMNVIATSARLTELTWVATVQELMPEVGGFIIDQGANARVSLNQKFAVYALTNASGVCHVYQVVAYAHANRIDPVSSLALVDQSVDPAGVKVGDLVMLVPAP